MRWSQFWNESKLHWIFCCHFVEAMAAASSYWAAGMDWSKFSLKGDIHRGTCDCPKCKPRSSYSACETNCGSCAGCKFREATTHFRGCEDMPGSFPGAIKYHGRIEQTGRNKFTLQPEWKYAWHWEGPELAVLVEVRHEGYGLYSRQRSCEQQSSSWPFAGSTLKFSTTDFNWFRMTCFYL